MLWYGFTESEWERGKVEITEILRKLAKERGMIAYGDLSRRLSTIEIGPHDPAMGEILGEISKSEDAEGRGMLSALVVHMQNDLEPGNGFYTCAESLGRDVSNRQACWITEMHKVHDYWANKHK